MKGMNAFVSDGISYNDIFWLIPLILLGFFVAFLIAFFH